MSEDWVQAAADRAEAASEVDQQPDRGGRFVTGGKPGPGRPKGSRNKLGEDFVAALQADFADHGAAAIAFVREEKPDQYLKVIASILPKEVKISTEVDLSDEELDQRIRQLAAALDLSIGGEGRAGEAASGEAEAARPKPAGSVQPVH